VDIICLTSNVEIDIFVKQILQRGEL